jgi:hypothetical protein
MMTPLGVRICAQTRTRLRGQVYQILCDGERADGIAGQSLTLFQP